MIFLPRAVRVYVATYPVNLHRSFDGLTNEAREVLALDPLSGHVLIFLNRRKNQVKLLVWTRGGFTIVHNQPSSHYTSFDFIGASWAVAAERAFAARSATRFHRLHCFAGGFGPGSS